MEEEVFRAEPDCTQVQHGCTGDRQLIELWLHGRSPHTQRAYAADVSQLLSRAGKPLASITLADLQSFAGTLAGLAPASGYRTLSAVKSLLTFGHRTGYLAFDVGRLLRLPTAPNQLAARILSEADTHRMIQLEENPRNRTLLMLLYASGIRVSELCRLCWRDLQFTGENGQVTVLGKGSRTRSVQIPASVWNLVMELKEAAGLADPVFRSRKKGGFLRPLAVLRIVRKAAQRAGLSDENVSPHWLRHAHASHALDRGAPIHLVQATLGHASITTTARYLHARPQDSSSRYLGL